MEHCFRVILYLTIAVTVSYGSIDFGSILGPNVDSETAWKKLMELENCPVPTTTEGMIIMVNESITAGAEYISNPEVSSRYECDFNCCNENHKCNVAVFATQLKHCYLFNCGSPSKCQFDYHAGYIVSILKEKKEPQPQTTLASKPLPTTAHPPKQVSMMGGCRSGIDSCSDTNTECREGFCLCVNGFHPKNGICRKDCLSGLEFECINGNKSYGQPDCIAIYDYCDGVSQCPDGSDERHCQEHMNHEQSLAELGQHDTSTDDKSVQDGANDKSDPDKIMMDHEKSVSTDEKSVSTDEKAVSTADKSVSADANPVSTDNKFVAAGENSLSADKRLNAENDTLVDSQEVLIATEPESENPISLARTHSTAIIALSIALSFTLIIAFYLAVQYRNVRKQLSRRGKPLKGSEVDYLIDGMYL